MTFKERYKKERADFAEFMKWYPFTLEDLDGEQWADIEGYEGCYQVSNFGRVKSLPNPVHKTPQIIRPTLNEGNYLKVLLCLNCKVKYHKVHRLVAQAFIPNPDNKPQVNHIDGCKINAYVGNLEWATNAENVQHAYDTGLNVARQGEECHHSKLTNEQAKYIRDNPEKLSVAKLAKIFCVSQLLVSEVQRGKRYTTAGGRIRTKKTALQGEECPWSKLTNEQVRYIRNNPEKLNTYELAKMFGVSDSIISNIQTGKTYKNAGGIIRKKMKTRLSDDIRNQIRAEYKEGVYGFGSYVLAKKYGVTTSTILKIIHEK